MGWRRAELYDLLHRQGFLKNARFRRIIPVILFLKNNKISMVRRLADSVDAVLDSMDFSMFVSLVPESGSWLQKKFARTKELLNQEELIDRLKKLERAMELKGLDGPQADVNLKQAKAARELAKTFEKIEEGAALIGSLCVVKAGKKMVVVTLSQEQLAKVNENPDWLKQPAVLRDAVFGPKEQNDTPFDEVPVERPMSNSAQAQSRRPSRVGHAAKPSTGFSHCRVLERRCST